MTTAVVARLDSLRLRSSVSPWYGLRRLTWKTEWILSLAEVGVDMRCCPHVVQLGKVPCSVSLTPCELSATSWIVGVEVWSWLDHLPCTQHAASLYPLTFSYSSWLCRGSSRDVCFFVPFVGELVCYGVFSSISWGYDIGGHRLKSYDDLERTLARSLTSLQVVRKLGNVE